MIRGIINHQRLELSSNKVVSDSIDYLEAEFTFSPDWYGAAKVAHFSNGTNTYDIILTDDKITKSAHLNLATGTWSVYLHGNISGTRITTDVQTLRVHRTGVLSGAPLPSIPLTVSEQLLVKVESAEDVAQSVRNDADAGKFNGKDYNHSAEYAALTAQMAAYQQQVTTDRAAIDADVESAAGSASEASGYASAAATSAARAEQIAVENGYFYFDVNDSGHLIETRTDNVNDDLSFALTNGKLEVTYA